MPSLTKQLIFPERKFTPADNINWQRVETLVHGPGASETDNLLRRGDGNSAVFACLMAVALAATEAPKKVYRKDREGKKDELPGPLQSLLDRPTIENALSPEEVDFWLSWALHSDGNAYLLKNRSGNSDRGNVVELWPVSPTIITPYTEKGSKDYITSYRLTIAPGQYEYIPRENVIHFRLGLDDNDMRLGLAPLKRLIREISTDYEATRFTESLLKNYAVPGLVIVPSAAAGIIDAQTATDIQNTFDRRLKNDGRGKTTVLSQEANIQAFGFSPHEMDLGLLHRLPEERIAAVIGVPAIIAGLGAGLERSTYSNFKEAREMFTETRLVPYWRMTASKLTTSLVPDFYNGDDTISIAYDLSDVRSLQDDEDALYRRLDIGVRGRWIAPSEARSDVGLPPELPPDMLPELQPMPIKPEEDAGAKMRPFSITKKAIRDIPGQNPLDPDERQLRRLERDGERRVTAALRDWRTYILQDANVATVQMLPNRAASPIATKPLTTAVAGWLMAVTDAGVEEGRRQTAVLLDGKKFVDLADWELPNIDAANWAMQYAGELVKGIVETTLARLRRDLELFVQSGEELESLVERITNSYAFGPVRARMIAVTEVTRAYAYGNQRAWKASGFIEKKAWRTAVDEVVCPICSELNDKVVGIDDSFKSSYVGDVDLPPAHVNCRCWIVPEIIRKVSQ